MEESSKRAKEFGLHLHRIRTEVFDESLRVFAKRIHLSPSYIGKIENGEVGAPRRSTVMDIAERLTMRPDALLLKAGYIPEGEERTGDDEYLLMLIGTLDANERGAVKAYIQHVKDYGITQKGDGPER